MNGNWERAEGAFRAAGAGSALNIVGMALDAGLYSSHFHRVPVAHVLSIVVSAGLWALLCGRWSRPSSRLGGAAFMFNNLMIAAALAMDGSPLELPGTSFMPFQAHKLGVLAVAVLAPPSVGVGLLSIAVFVAPPLLQLASYDPSLRTALPSEPVATIAYGVFAVGLYAYRLYGRRERQKMAQALAEAAALQRVSRVLLAVRDSSNTPLQTLQLTALLLERRCPEARTQTERLARGVARLQEMNRTIAKYETDIAWTKDDESFDPTAVLEGRGRT